MILGFDAAVVGRGMTVVAIYCGNRLWRVQQILRNQPINKWGGLWQMTNKNKIIAHDLGMLVGLLETEKALVSPYTLEYARALLAEEQAQKSKAPASLVEELTRLVEVEYREGVESCEPTAKQLDKRWVLLIKDILSHYTPQESKPAAADADMVGNDRLCFSERIKAEKAFFKWAEEIGARNTPANVIAWFQTYHPVKANDDVGLVDNTEDYDAGLLNDYGGGNVGWWHDYIRNVLSCCNEHWRESLSRHASSKEALK